MLLQSDPLRGPVRAIGARERPFPRVNPQVFDQFGRPREPLATHAAGAVVRRGETLRRRARGVIVTLRAEGGGSFRVSGTVKNKSFFVVKAAQGYAIIYKNRQ